MQKPKLSPWMVVVLPLLGLALLVGSCFKKGITSLDDPTITTKTCSDYPRGQAPADCITTEHLMGVDQHRINHPIPFVLGLIVFTVWGWLLYGSQRAQHDPTGSKTSTAKPLTKTCVGCKRQIAYYATTCDFCGVVQP